jgi:hypothetical protein
MGRSPCSRDRSIAVSDAPLTIGRDLPLDQAPPRLPFSDVAPQELSPEHCVPTFPRRDRSASRSSAA